MWKIIYKRRHKNRIEKVSEKCGILKEIYAIRIRFFVDCSDDDCLSLCMVYCSVYCDIDILYAFCFGAPPMQRDRESKSKKKLKSCDVHRSPIDIKQHNTLINAHATWLSCRRVPAKKRYIAGNNNSDYSKNFFCCWCCCCCLRVLVCVHRIFFFQFSFRFVGCRSSSVSHITHTEHEHWAAKKCANIKRQFH